jgi:predicted transcriptional regulator
MSQTSPTRQLAIQYLAQNLAPSQVAAILGVTESAISQLMADPDFAEAVAASSQGAAAADLEHDNRIDAIESRLLDNLESRANFANFQQSMQAFKILNGAKRRQDTKVHNTLQQGGVTVNLTLPESLIPRYVLNAQAEVVEVDGKTMISATPANVNAMLEARKGAKLPQPAGVSEAIPIEQVKHTRALEGASRMTNRPQRKAVPLIDLI